MTVAVIKYAVPVVRISGRIGSQQTALGGCQSSTTIRKTGTQKASDTPQQAQARELLSIVTKFWSSGLSQSDRDGWEAFAATGVYDNRLCNTVPRTGLSVWTTFGVQQMLTVGTLAPSPPVLPEPVAFESVDRVQLVGVDFLLLTATNSYDVGDDFFIVCKLSPGKNSQSQKPRITEYRYVAGYANLQAAGGPIWPSRSSQPLYAGEFAYTYAAPFVDCAVGQWVGVQIWITNLDGRPSAVIKRQMQVEAYP